MRTYLKEHIEYLLCIKIDRIRSVSGGDISQAYVLETEIERFFCKINSSDNAFQMFEVEKCGLASIESTKTIATPKVLLCENLEVGGFLLMEYIEPKIASAQDMAQLGHHLAALHQVYDTNNYGWETDNFIGSLPQSNKIHPEWTSFYVEERLLPQLKIARDANLLSTSEVPSEERIVKTCESLFLETTPSLLHGDLWNGNYLISKNGTPYLIDPAVYLGHNEVDLAMTRLFGGFDRSFYAAYSELFPSLPQEKERADIYQLYYLLVHLNMFGTSYYGSVSSIFKRYF